MKRKDLEDDFSQFSLQSPATKIRRILMDGGLAPIMEEEDLDLVGGLAVDSAMMEDVDAELLPVENEERALVLYKPVEKREFQYTVDKDIISSFKDQFRRARSSGLPDAEADDEVKSSKEEHVPDNSMAVIPWVQLQYPSAGSLSYIPAPVTDTVDSMEADGVAEMEIEEIPVPSLDGRHHCYHATGLPNQHCMGPNVPQNTSAPVMWYSG